jgi:Arc/MetJ family transcription regulator
VTKRLVEIDDQLLERARSAAGTTTIKSTVEAALRQVARDAIAVEHVRRLRRGGVLELDALEAARRPRTARA